MIFSLSAIAAGFFFYIFSLLIRSIKIQNITLIPNSLITRYPLLLVLPSRKWSSYFSLNPTLRQYLLAHGYDVYEIHSTQQKMSKHLNFKLKSILYDNKKIHVLSDPSLISYFSNEQDQTQSWLASMTAIDARMHTYNLKIAISLAENDLKCSH